MLFLAFPAGNQKPKTLGQTNFLFAGNVFGFPPKTARLGVPEEKSVLLQHLILSHHGEPEFGAAVRPLCAEAELLSLIDAIDSRMEIYRETYETMDADTFSPRIFALEKKIFKHS